ncbi:hypothetical protein KR222_011592 [Zaprionus bogoriensis]|nr:hypothetical protein KR222_011592 [Zaprionus bogoriensis]
MRIGILITLFVLVAVAAAQGPRRRGSSGRALGGVGSGVVRRRFLIEGRNTGASSSGERRHRIRRIRVPRHRVVIIRRRRCKRTKTTTTAATTTTEATTTTAAATTTTEATTAAATTTAATTTTG